MSSTPRDLYGAEPPSRLTRATRILSLLVGTAVFVACLQALVVYLWGPPPGWTPLVTLDTMRLWGGGVCILAAVGLLRPAWRKLALSSMGVGVTLSLAPLYSPVLSVQLLRALNVESALAAALALGLTAALVFTAGARVRVRRASVKGSTTWGKGAPLRKANKGMLLGRDADGRLLRYAGDGHLMTVAATRGGKGVGAIIPNLLNHPGSLVCTDPKGENYAVTARHRATMPGHKVVAIDPFDLTDGQGGFNPMDMIDLEDKSCVEVATSMADNIMGKPTKTADPYWINAGKQVLKTFILFVKALPPEEQTLTKVQSLLALPLEVLHSLLLEDMQDHPLQTVRDGANMLMQKHEKELSGVLSTVQSKMEIFGSPRLKASLQLRSFTPEELMEGNVSVYLIIPREHLTAYAPWLRLMVTTLYNTISRQAARRPKPKDRILFMLDEFANLGRMQEALDAVSLGAGFGITLWLILQDLAQLKQHYADAWQSFMANCDVLQVFAMQDTFSCDEVSKMLGDATVWQRDVKRERGQKHGRVMQEYKEEARRLLKPDEIRRLDARRQILFVRPLKPVCVTKLRYYAEPMFRGQWDRNPYLT